MEGMMSFITAGIADISDKVCMAAVKATEATTEAATQATTQDERLKELFETSGKAEQLSSNIMDIIYILIAMVVVVAIFTITLYIYKFFKNRRDPNYKKNDDTFLDD